MKCVARSLFLGMLAATSVIIGDACLGGTMKREVDLQKCGSTSPGGAPARLARDGRLEMTLRSQSATAQVRVSLRPASLADRQRPADYRGTSGDTLPVYPCASLGFISSAPPPAMRWFYDPDFPPAPSSGTARPCSWASSRARSSLKCRASSSTYGHPTRSVTSINCTSADASSFLQRRWLRNCERRPPRGPESNRVHWLCRRRTAAGPALAPEAVVGTGHGRDLTPYRRLLSWVPMSGGIYRSTDGCRSWQIVNTGIPNLYVNTITFPSHTIRRSSLPAATVACSTLLTVGTLGRFSEKDFRRL